MKSFNEWVKDHVVNEISAELLLRASNQAANKSTLRPSDQISKDRVEKFKQAAIDRTSETIIKNEKTGEIKPIKILRVYHANAIGEDSFVMVTNEQKYVVDLAYHTISFLTSMGKAAHSIEKDADKFQIEIGNARELIDKINNAGYQSNQEYMRKSAKTYKYQDLPLFRNK
jgi:hypothetical protein